MLLLISDTNVLFDFEDGGLLDELFRLEATIAVPDVILEEEMEEIGDDLLRRGLQCLTLGSAGVVRVVELARLHRRPSRNDLMALALAEQEDCPLLTGDRHLREAAILEGVDVRGTLWVAEELVVNGIMDPERMRTAYRDMRAAGRRLPWSEVDRQLTRWGQRPLHG